MFDAHPQTKGKCILTFRKMHKRACRSDRFRCDPHTLQGLIPVCTCTRLPCFWVVISVLLKTHVFAQRVCTNN